MQRRTELLRQLMDLTQGGSCVGIEPDELLLIKQGAVQAYIAQALFHFHGDTHANKNFCLHDFVIAKRGI